MPKTRRNCPDASRSNGNRDHCRGEPLKVNAPAQQHRYSGCLRRSPRWNNHSSPLARFDPKVLETAFWEGKPIRDRIITTTDVLDGYQTDFCSLRSALFVRELFKKQIHHEEHQVTAENVVAEFTCNPDKKQKCQAAQAQFMAFCCVKGVPLDARAVNPDTVAGLYPGTPEGQLGLARFRSSCCLNNIPLAGKPVTRESVIAHFTALKAELALARFMSTCCLNNLPVNGQLITAQEVIDQFPDDQKGRLGVARFKEECLKQNYRINGQSISTDSVLHELKAAGTLLEQARFKASCCLKSLPLNHQQVTTETVVKDFREASATLELARFKAQCCLQALTINGHPVSVSEVLECYPLTRCGRLGRTRFKVDCCMEGLLLDGQPIATESIIRDFLAIDEKLGMARFRQSCFENGLLINGKQVSPETVMAEFQALGNKLGEIRFKEYCCLSGKMINGRPITPDSVVADFRAANTPLELARFKQSCYQGNLPINGQPVAPRDVLDSFPCSRLGKLGQARFLAICCLEGKPISGKPVSTETVVNTFRAVSARLELARFKEKCCLNNLTINGRLITADEVAEDFRACRAKLELARFWQICYQQSVWLEGQPVSPEAVVKNHRALGTIMGLLTFREWCCLNGQKLYGRHISAASVVDGYKGRRNEIINIARFMAKCCLQGLPVHNLPVTPEAVIGRFPTSHSGRMGLALFKEGCFLRGLHIHGQPITAESVLQCYPDSQEGKVSRARFMDECCLKGLYWRGRPIPPQLVIDSYPGHIVGQLCIARFKENCFHKGLSVRGNFLTPEGVAEEFPTNQEGVLGLGRFMERCCLRGIPLHGQPVTPEAAMNVLQKANSRAACAAFLADCFLRDLRLDGKRVQARDVLDAYPLNQGGRQQMIFLKRQACLNGLKLLGKYVTPEQVVNDYHQKNRLLDKAVFCAQLALRAIKLNGKYLTNAQVLETFSQVPGGSNTKKVEFLTQRLMALPPEDDEAGTIVEQARQILEAAPLKDEINRYQYCVLQFLALQNDLMVLGKPVNPEQLWQLIRALRVSFNNTRLQFYFLAYCYRSRIVLEGQPVTAQLVWDCLNQLPQSKVRHYLSCWFEETRYQPGDVVSQLLPATPQRLTAMNNSRPRQPKWVDVYIDDLASGGPFPARIAEYFDDPPAPGLIKATTRKALNIVHSIRGLRITGSFSRYLQGIGDGFNDIDLLGTTQAIKLLISRLTTQLGEMNSENPCKVFAQMIPGCPQLHLPDMCSITLVEGDYGHKLPVMQVSVYPPQTLQTFPTTESRLPTSDGEPATCLSFITEVRLMSDTLQFLESQLDPLTAQLQRGMDLKIPRTILFNFPNNPRERIFGLLMRCLLTLNKAREFSVLLTSTRRDSFYYASVHAKTQAKTLHNLQRHGRRLHARLLSHPQRQPLMETLTQWLSAPPPDNPYQHKKRDFIRTLLGIVENPAEPF